MKRGSVVVSTYGARIRSERRPDPRNRPQSIDQYLAVTGVEQTSRPIVAVTTLQEASSRVSAAEMDPRSLLAPAMKSIEDERVVQTVGVDGCRGTDRRRFRRQRLCQPTRGNVALQPAASLRRRHLDRHQSTPFAGSKLFRPDDGRRHLSLILLHGSEGGSDPEFAWYARLWSKLGYAVLAYCYFDCDRKGDALPASLKNVETSKVLDAVGWLRRQPFADGKVAVFGFSMGAEMALIVGSLESSQPAPDALIAHSPGQFFDPPFNPNWVKPSCWTCIGQCKTKAPRDPDPNFKWHPYCGADTPDTLDDAKSGWLTYGKSVPSGTRIPIEKFDGPILLIQGENDTAWHGRGQTHDVEDRWKNPENFRRPTIFPAPGMTLRGLRTWAARCGWFRPIPKNSIGLRDIIDAPAAGGVLRWSGNKERFIADMVMRSRGASAPEC